MTQVLQTVLGFLRDSTAVRRGPQLTGTSKLVGTTHVLDLVPVRSFGTRTRLPQLIEFIT
eukprot:COSAG01_NODE_5669_length_4105_cov_18.145922_3_plen_60_part_00